MNTRACLSVFGKRSGAAAKNKIVCRFFLCSSGAVYRKRHSLPPANDGRFPRNQGRSGPLLGGASMKYVLGMAIAATALILCLDANYAGEPKYTIKEVMKKAHAGKGAIMKAVAAGKASEEEKKELVE